MHLAVPPFGNSNDINEIRWSKWLESMRKDVEYTFGILKGRWRMLKSGLHISGVDSVDYIWFHMLCVAQLVARY